VTTFKFKTYPAPKTGINWAWRWTLDNNAEDTVDKKVKIFQAMQDYAVTAPSNMALRMFTMPMYGGYEVSGVYWGSLADFNATIAPLVNNLPQDGISDVREYGFLELLVVLAGSVPLPQPENYTEHNTFVSLPPQSTFDTCQGRRTKETPVHKIHRLPHKTKQRGADLLLQISWRKRGQAPALLVGPRGLIRRAV